MNTNNEYSTAHYYFEVSDKPTGKILETVIIEDKFLAWKHFYDFVEKYSLSEKSVESIIQLLKLKQSVLIKDKFTIIQINASGSFPILTKEELQALDDPILRDNKKTKNTYDQ